MRRLNELRTVEVGFAAGRRIEGVERIRGIDARRNGRGLVFATRTAEAVVVHEPDGLHRVSLPAAPGGRALSYAIPAALFFMTKVVLRSRRKAR